LDRLPPASGGGALRWTSLAGTTWAEVFTRLAYHQNRYTTSDRANTERIPPDGLPGYAVFGVRGGHALSDHLSLSLAVENIADRDYRIMDSGLNEPGTNVIVTVLGKF
jgi:outer membrane receptor protein involved in Fe transport